MIVKDNTLVPAEDTWAFLDEMLIEGAEFDIRRDAGITSVNVNFNNYDVDFSVGIGSSGSLGYTLETITKLWREYRMREHNLPDGSFFIDN